MPEAKVACESCPWPARGKRPAGASLSDELKREVADGIAQDCREDGGTCYGAVRFAMSDAADAYRQPPTPCAGRGQGPDVADHRPDFTPATTAVDFVPTPESED